ncbi:MAG TPA: FAD-binding oxidoreductase [Bryobacteraceae bacterium]|nr:FAD-binding oxidoreductase [Bryobacteraceae bacterium]
MTVTEISDASYFPGHADQVLTPHDEAELLDILHRANENRIPATIMGALTGVTGAAVPRGGWAISLTRLNRIEIQPGRAIVGPGALLRDVQSAAEQSGQFYAPDPTENTSSIGGNIAANASGSRSYRFGATRNHVLALRVAQVGGEILQIRRGQPFDFDVPAIRLPRTTKHSAGYRLAPGMDFVDLFIGSEGTLGVVTQAELQLLPPRGERLSGVVFFKSEEAALDAVDRWRGANLNMIEYLDRASLELMDVPHAAALMIEQEGDAELDAVLSVPGALEAESWFAISAADRERFREFRHALPERCNDRIRRSGFMKLSTDYAVPLDKTREMLKIYRKMLEPPYVIFGHVGDAHLHINTFSDSPQRFERNQALMTELARAAVDLGGTVGAEHGLGKRKAHLLQIQYSPEEIEAMRAVKRRFDPHWRLGQGTLLSNSPGREPEPLG